MKRTARRFVVKDKVYGLTVEFYVNTPQKTALRRCAAVMEMDANDPENQPDEDAAAWAFSDRNWHCVWLSDGDDEGSRAHEICHVVCAVLRHIEGSDEEEARCYITGHIHAEFAKKWSRK